MALIQGTYPTKKLKALPKALEVHNYNFAKALRAVGYAKSVCNVPALVKRKKGYHKVMEPVIKKFESVRDKAFKHISEGKLSETDAKGLAEIVDKMQRNIQLLSGRPTETVNHMATLTDEQLNAIAEGRSAA